MERGTDRRVRGEHNVGDRRGHALIDGSPEGVVVVSSSYALKTIYGSHSLGEAENIELSLLSLLDKDEVPFSRTCQQALFLDIETAMILGETPVVMAGLGRFGAESFSLTQFFAPDPSGEGALLQALARAISEEDVLVSFNGRDFDVPVLESRFHHMGTVSPFRRLSHVDLCRISRRLWKGILPDCRLRTIEIERLGVSRIADIGSRAVPRCYQAFLDTGQRELIEQIADHNRYDILSLVALAGLLGTILCTPESGNVKDDDLLAAGRELLRLNHPEMAVRYLEIVAAAASFDEWEGRYWLARAYKSLRRWDHASRLWNELIGLDPRRSSEPYVELAWFFERAMGDCRRAADILKEALQVFPAEHDVLSRRIRRLS